MSHYSVAVFSDGSSDLETMLAPFDENIYVPHYGTGLQVNGWHLNGESEPFDSFYDSAVECMNESDTTPICSESAKEVWSEFGDIPMNPETECIEESWRSFPAGTHREDIWHWFESTFKVSVHDLMYGE